MQFLDDDTRPEVLELEPLDSEASEVQVALEQLADAADQDGDRGRRRGGRTVSHRRTSRC